MPLNALQVERASSPSMLACVCVCTARALLLLLLLLLLLVGQGLHPAQACMQTLCLDLGTAHPTDYAVFTLGCTRFDACNGPLAQHCVLRADILFQGSVHGHRVEDIRSLLATHHACVAAKMALLRFLFSPLHAPHCWCDVAPSAHLNRPTNSIGYFKLASASAVSPFPLPRTPLPCRVPVAHHPAGHAVGGTRTH